MLDKPTVNKLGPIEAVHEDTPVLEALASQAAVAIEMGSAAHV